MLNRISGLIAFGYILRGGEMILIFEDNMDIALVLKRMLNLIFHEPCVITCNCAVAENMVLAGGIGLVLSDLNIEGREGQGLDLIKKIKRTRPHTSPPIVVYTGLSKGDSAYDEAEIFSDMIFEKSETPLVQLCKEICRLMKLRQRNSTGLRISGLSD